MFDSKSIAAVKLNIYRWYWWFRPKAHLLIPAALLTLVAIQLIAAILHYNKVIHISVGDDPQSSGPTPSSAATTTGVVYITPSGLNVNDYDPQAGVSFAIPVGGYTERSKQLDEILTTLINGGALASNIVVFEDVYSRPNGASVPVANVASAHGVKVIPSKIDRSRGEDGGNFGIHLARHYHFFLDYLLAGDSAVDSIEVSPNGPFDFAVVIEDDLAVSPDLVKFFFSMSRVMLIDDSLYCVAAHQDNAFLGIHRDDEFDREIHSQTSLASDSFDFRRGNHFMAPGWMTSRKIYTEIVRPMWLDGNGEYSHKEELHLRNGHWDRFFDSMIRDKDCIFPELPRITHQGADGFTVSKRGQMELYSNLRLAQLPISVNYGDLARLTKQGYIQETILFIQSSKRLNVLEESRKYRHDKLVYVVPAQDDKDEEWNSVINNYFGLIGVGGYGGHLGYVKVRGIFHGAVFIRWLTNLILLVGSYSPYLNHVSALPHLNDGLEISYVGCYKDDWDRDLPHQVPHYTAASLTPRRCLASCQHLGYRFAGAQNAFECWCGNSYGKHQQDGIAGKENLCFKQCTSLSKGLLANLLTSTAGKEGDSLALSQPNGCGSGFQNSIYTNVHPETSSLPSSLLQPPSGISYLVGVAGESCDDVCSKRGGSHPRCDERYFPLIHRSCAILTHLFGSDSCHSCIDEDDPEKGFATPAYNPQQHRCFFSRARYHRCNWQPPAELIRACTCVQ